ncbi:uncharacterized protein LOC135806415 [Sycon ciliatum]|uniref:uncharacterized protein LOC135806415 n=1 Tax=Sycon ciliatum TaxID=27933 RepID=UPI0031F68FD6
MTTMLRVVRGNFLRSAVFLPGRFSSQFTKFTSGDQAVSDVVSHLNEILEDPSKKSDFAGVNRAFAYCFNKSNVAKRNKALSAVQPLLPRLIAERPAEEIADLVSGLVTGHSTTFQPRANLAGKACHQLLLAAEETGMSLAPSIAASLFLSMSILRGKNNVLEALLKHALMNTDELRTQDVINLLRGAMLWEDVPRDLKKRISHRSVVMNVEELSNESVSQLAGCMIRLKINPQHWIEGLEDFVRVNAMRLSETADGLALLSKVVFTICNNAVALPEVLETVNHALNTLKSSLTGSSAWVHLIWCCALEDMYPVKSLQTLFSMDAEDLRRLAGNKTVVKFLNDLHWLFVDGKLESSIVGGFPEEQYTILLNNFNAIHPPRRFVEDWRTRFKGAHCCLFDVRTRENYTLDVAVLRSTIDFDFLRWDDHQLHPAEVTARKMDRRRYCSAQAVLILESSSFIQQSFFPLGWVRMQKKVLESAGWDVSVIPKILLKRSGADGPTVALKDRLDDIHENNVLHCHGRKKSVYIPRDTEENFLEPKVHKPSAAKMRYMKLMAARARKLNSRQQITSGPKVREP